MNSAVLHQHQHGQPNIAVPRTQTSFLSLPIELRTAIYEHLIPNDVVYGYWYSDTPGPPDRRPVRHDKQPCCPAILRINRQIHDEVIGMFYGTACFGMHVIGSYCYFLGMKYQTEDLQNANANKLPPNFRFVRSLYIGLYIRWPTWPSDEQPSLESALPPLPLEPLGTTLIAECLSTGSYEFRQVALGLVVPCSRQMRAVIDSTLEDGGKLFKEVLKQHLAPLRILRGADLKFDDLSKIGREGVARQRIIIDSLRSKEEVLPVFARLERIRMRVLRKLAEEVSQYA